MKQHHGIKYSYAALEAAAELAAVILLIVFCLIKPLMLSMKPVLINVYCQQINAKKLLSVTDIEQIVAKIARIPEKVSASDKDTLRNLERDLKLVIFGQDEAIEALCCCR